MVSKLSLLGVPFSGGAGPQNYVRDFSESISVSESLLTNLDNYHVRITEAFTVSDAKKFYDRKAKTEIVEYDESRNKHLHRNITQTITYLDARTRHFELNISEELGFAEDSDEASDDAQYYSEGIEISDAIAKRLHRNIEETISQFEKAKYPSYFKEILEHEVVMTRIGEFIRTPDEEIEFDVLANIKPRKFFPTDIEYSETFTKRLHKQIEERFIVHDTLLRQANAVMFDLVIRDDVMTVSEFDEVADSPPVGYTPFRQFNPGDYEFQKFMVGIRLSGPSGSGQAGIIGLKHNVDVPDVTDRGQATVTPTDIASHSGQHTVTFAKQFTIPPEVYPTWIGGTSYALPEILSVTETGFVFILRDISSPVTLVEGTISWAAIGR